MAGRLRGLRSVPCWCSAKLNAFAGLATISAEALLCPPHFRTTCGCACLRPALLPSLPPSRSHAGDAAASAPAAPCSRLAAFRGSIADAISSSTRRPGAAGRGGGCHDPAAGRLPGRALCAHPLRQQPPGGRRLPGRGPGHAAGQQRRRVAQDGRPRIRRRLHRGGPGGRHAGEEPRLGRPAGPSGFS